MSELYPLLLRLDGRKCVIVGGGGVALRKAEGLLRASASVHVVAPVMAERLQELGASGRLILSEKPFTPADLDGAALAFAATNRAEVNREVAKAAAERGIPVNWADDGARGDFVTPATLRRGQLIMAVSASGAGPALAARIVRELEATYGEEYTAYLEILKQVRATVRAFVPDIAARARLLRAAASRRGMAELMPLRSEQDVREKGGGEALIAALQRLADGEDGKNG